MRSPALVLLLALMAVVPACRFVSTQLSRIVSAPGKYHGQGVTVSGRVEAIRWIPETGAMGFRLVEGEDSLLVLTLGDPPRSGSRVRLVGQISRRFPVEGRERVVLFYHTGIQPMPASASDTR